MKADPVAKKSDDIDIVATVLRWRILRLEARVAGLRAKIQFWDGRSLVTGGGLPMSVTERLCEWIGTIGELEHRITSLRQRLAARNV